MSTGLKATIQQLSEDIHREVVVHRRHLHAHPELSFEENETAEYISEALSTLGIPHKRTGDTGITGFIEGKKSANHTVALRADIDALPIQEENNVQYKSRHDGVMHACGHDVHTASLLGALHVLKEVENELPKTVRFIFQPAEEKVPGGAQKMIEAGVLKDPQPNAILAQHVHPPLEAGTVGFRPGMYMASSDEIYITVKGKGGHAAMPHEAVDPVVIASHLVVALQQLVSRHSNPTTPCVLTFGRIAGGVAPNVIPNAVLLGGTLRTFEESWRKEAQKRIIKLANELCGSMGATCEVEIRAGYPALRNNEELTIRARESAEEFLGKENVKNLPMRMTGEDFSRYALVVPGCFYRLGTSNKKKNITSMVHTPTFDIDEDAMKVGVGLMAWLAASV